MIYSAYKLKKQGYNIQPWCTPFLTWNQSVVPCPVLTVAFWPAYRFLRRQVRCSGIILGFPDDSMVKESACQCGRLRRCNFHHWVGKIPWRKKRQPTPVFLPGKSHGQRSLVDYNLWGRTESDMIEGLSIYALMLFCHSFLPSAFGALSVGSWVSLIFLHHCVLSLKYFLASRCYKLYLAHLVFLCPSLKISHFFKDPWSYLSYNGCLVCSLLLGYHCL